MSKWLAATFCLQSELESERKQLVKNSEGTGMLEQFSGLEGVGLGSVHGVLHGELKT